MAMSGLQGERRSIQDSFRTVGRYRSSSDDAVVFFPAALHACTSSPEELSAKAHNVMSFERFIATTWRARRSGGIIGARLERNFFFVELKQRIHAPFCSIEKPIDIDKIDFGRHEKKTMTSTG